MATVRIIGGALHAGTAGQTWILGSISIGLAAFLLAAGALADDYGRRRVFVLGALVLALGSVVSAVAPNVTVFVLGRIIQGMGSAAILAASLGLIGHEFPSGPERAHATGLWGAAVGGGIFLGPLLTSLIGGDWSVSYWLIAVVSVALALWANAALVESRSHTPRRVDLPGVITLGSGIAFLVAALTEGRGGWFRTEVLLFLLAAVILLGLFVIAERRSAEPMLDLGLLRRPAFLASVLGALVTGIAVIGLMSYLPGATQRTLGFSPLGSAVILGVWSGLSFVVALQSKKLIHRIGIRHQLAGGLVLCAIGALFLIGIGPSAIWRLVLGLAIAGVGSGFVNASLAGLAVQSVPAGQVSMGSGANNTARYLGSSLGIAVIVGIGALTPAAIVSAVVAVLGAVAVYLCRDRVPNTAVAVTASR
ncbi:MFS transporter [Pseudonocardiaceae bacterium YIM PH 21723]|nr:MFS transporter [Pseudonocardiaceae bacterium YIM PH 21723]